MDALWSIAEGAVILALGLAARLGMLIVVLTLMLAVVLPIVYTGEGVRKMWHAFHHR
jgi:hypothetical protein